MNVRFLTTALVLALCASMGYAQATREQIEQYITGTEQRIEHQEARVKSVTDQMLSLDADIESSAGQIVKMLSTSRDSEDSKRRIVRQKQDAIEGLKKSIEAYFRERERRLNSLIGAAQIGAGTSMEEEELEKDVAMLDERIEKRVDQIMAISKSLTSQQSFESVRRYQDWDTDYTRETREYKHQKSVASKSVKEKRALADDLRASTKRLSKENSDLRKIAAAAQTEEARKDVEAHIKHNEDLITKRNKQIEQLMSGGSGTRQVGSKAAFEMGKLIDDMREDIRRDYNRLRALRPQRDNERIQLKRLKDRLAAAHRALDDFDSEGREPAAPKEEKEPSI